MKIKIDRSFVVVREPFPKEIHKLDPTYGIEVDFYTQKPVAVLLRLWRIFFFLSFAFFVISLFVGNGAFTKAAIVILFTVHFPFVIPLAIYLIKWINRKK